MDLKCDIHIRRKQISASSTNPYAPSLSSFSADFVYFNFNFNDTILLVHDYSVMLRFTVRIRLRVSLAAD